MYVSIDIIDNGKGICNEDMKHIFDRFYKKIIIVIILVLDFL